MNSRQRLFAISGATLCLALSSPIWTADALAQAQNQPQARDQERSASEAAATERERAQRGGADITVQQPAPQVSVQQPAPQVQVEQPAPQVQVQQPQPEVTVQQAQPKVTVQQPQPEVTVQQPPPQVTVQQPKPEVTVQQQKPEVSVQQQQPEVTVQETGRPEVTVQETGRPEVTVQETGQPEVTVQEQGQPQVGQQPGMAEAEITQQAPSMRVSKVQGTGLRTAAGEEIGEVADVIVSREGRADQVVLEVEGKRVAVPFDAVTITGQDHATYRGDLAQLRQLPEYSPAQIAGGGKAPEPLVGREVRTARGEEIGKVDDLIITRGGDVQVVLSSGGFLGIGEKLVAVPFRSVQLTSEDYLIYEGTREQIAQLPEFDYEQQQRGMGGITEEPIQERRREGVTQ